MSIQILRLAGVFYLVAAVAYVVFFAKPRLRWLAGVGQTVLAIAFVVHAAAIGFGCKEFGGTEFFSLRGGFIVLSWLAGGAFLVLNRMYRIPTLGAFVLPLILVVLLPALFLGHSGRIEVIPDAIRRPALPVHIISAFLGIALFALAAGVAVMYLLQEREVKGKRFGALFSRLPSLDSLDKLNQRLVRAGFVVFTVALVTGTFIARNVWKSAWSWDPQQVSSLVVWLLYGVMVQLRHTGWHGRRYAMLTLVGFALVIGSMVGLAVVPDVTRHGGDYQ
jgi:ABC-type transport system involved in cytochrome c biogenesis permease subunit